MLEYLYLAFVIGKLETNLKKKQPLYPGNIHMYFLLDSRPLPDGSYKVGFGSLAFSETWHGVRGPYIVVCDRAGFFGKNPHQAKMTKNGQKWSKNMVFGLFKKITSLVLSGICVKWKFLWFINILRKLHAWEKSGSQVIAKNGSRPMRFQYSLIVNISLID